MFLLKFRLCTIRMFHYFIWRVQLATLDPTFVLPCNSANEHVVCSVVKQVRVLLHLLGDRVIQLGGQFQGGRSAIPVLDVYKMRSRVTM